MNVQDIKQIVADCMAINDTANDTKDEGLPRRFEQRVAIDIRRAVSDRWPGNWNVVMGKKIGIAAGVGDKEGYAVVDHDDYVVFVFQYNAV